MYRFMVFVLLGSLACGPAMADRAVAPVAPPKVEGMVAEAPAEDNTEPMGELPAEVPDYRGAQKPQMPKAAKPPVPPTP